MSQARLVLFVDNSVASVFTPVSPPLPTALQLPLELISALRESGMSGILLSAISGALACVVMNRILADWNTARQWRLPILALFALNPAILLYSTNGSSEMITVLLVLASVRFLFSWYQSDNLQALASLGFALGLASLTRYEAVLFAIPFLGAISLLARNTPRSTPGRVQGLLITSLVPMSFIVGAWVLFDLLITKDFTHFGRMIFASVVQISRQAVDILQGTVGIDAGIQPAWSAVGSFFALFPFLAVGVALLLADYFHSRNRDSLSLAILALTVPALQALSSHIAGDTTLPHNSILTIPLGMIVAGHIMSRTTLLGLNGKTLLSIKGILLVALGASTIASGVAVDPSVKLGKWENAGASGFISQQHVYSRQDKQDAARYLLENSANGRVMADPGEGYGVIFFTGHDGILVIDELADFSAGLKRT